MPAEHYKYKTRLHALLSKGPVPSRRAWQDSILTYLTQNCSVSNDFEKKKEKKSFFASPLPINVVPKQSLIDELRTEENGFIPVVLASHVNCTADVLAALCHLFPQGATVPYKDGSLALHFAARQPTGTASKKKMDATISDNLKGIGVLAEAYPMALVTRDDKGRTPLHVLLENHASTRHVELIERLSRTVDEKVWRYEVEAQADEGDEKVPLPMPSVIRKKLPKQEQTGLNLFTPASALAIPDKIYGGTPLHYAVKNGAPKEVVASLIKGYPSSVSSLDCNKRTPLHWCLGAAGDSVSIGYANETMPMHHFHRSSNIISMLLKKDPAGNFNVASMKDRHPSGKSHRSPLHYAIELLAKNILDPAPAKADEKAPASCLTIKSLQAIIDSSKKGLLMRDANGQTPLHVLFRSVFEKHSLEYTKALHIAQTGAANISPPVEPTPFTPPAILVNLLLQDVNEDDFDEDESVSNASNASTVPDRRGLLPLHCAVQVAATPKVIKILVERNPKSLTQLTKGSVMNDTAFMRSHYDYLAIDDPLYVSSFEGSRTPIHFAFSNPFMSRAQTVEILDTLLHFESEIAVTAADDDDDSLSSDSEDEAASSKSKTGMKKIEIDGTIALKMQDASGDTPLHLAAKNQASLEMLQYLMEQDPEVVVFPGNKGDLPIHHLLDSNFLFVNADLATVHSTKDNNQDALDTQHTPEFRQSVRELAKKQTIVTRLQKFQLCGAIFAPSNGWTSEEEDGNKSYDVMRKINLLGMATIGNKQSLTIVGSDYGLNCLQIMIAFNAAPYKVISDILQSNPQCSHARSTVKGYTALDLHCIRRSIPNEVRKEELDCWKAVKELLFSYEAFPLELTAKQTSGAFYTCRKDKDMINSFEQQILAEISGDCLLSYHWKGNNPIDPIHMKLGFFAGVQNTPFLQDSEIALSEVCKRFWVFLAAFVNLDEPSDQHAPSIDRILEKLTFDETQFLLRMQIAPGTFKNVQTVDWDQSSLTIDHYANIFCKAIFHKYYHFAGKYDFTPSPMSSILLHEGRNCDSIIILATQREFQLNRPSDDLTDSSWMFDPSTDVRARDDYSIRESQVAFKFMTNRLDFERETKWREEFAKEGEIPGVVPIVTTFDPNCIDGEVDKKYAVDRLDKRFKNLPLNSKSNEEERLFTLDLTKYPYAIVQPFAKGGSLHDCVGHGRLNYTSAKRGAYEMASMLKAFHSRGLIHGSFSTRSVLNFSEDNGVANSMDLKLTDLTSLVPADQPHFKLGAITPGGKCLFDSSCLPPEMFMKVDSQQLSIYNQYWRSVREIGKVSIPDELTKPRIDPISNDTFVMKCYCNLDEKTAELLPPLPYELLECDESVDVWSFGVFMFTLVSEGESIIIPNARTGRLASFETIATWNTDVAEAIITQSVDDLAAQDLLLHILVTKEQRDQLDMSIILSHPFFEASAIPKKITKLMEEAKEERELIGKVRRRQKERALNEKSANVTHLGRLGLRTQLRLTNSATSALKSCFDPKTVYSDNTPFTHVLLPYKLTRNAEDRLVPGTKMDMELAQRLGKQLLELTKAVGFAACYTETLATRSEKFQQSISVLFMSPDIDPIQAGQNILATFHLDAEHYRDLATKFVMIVKETIKENPQSFIDDPMDPVLKLVSEYVTTIAKTYTIPNRAFLYLVDEFANTVALPKDSGGTYPHVFRDHLFDVVYKSLPYMYTCVSSALCAEAGPEGLLKLVSEGAYPNVPESWGDAFRGIPIIPLRRRMVAEAKIVHQICHSLISPQSPLALNGESEMQFYNSLFTHIDSSRSFAGLTRITDETGSMWVSEQSRFHLLNESAEESTPERVYEIYAREEAEFQRLQEKDKKISQLEKALRKTTQEVEKLRNDYEI